MSYKLKLRKDGGYAPVYRYNNSKNAKYVTIKPYIQINGKRYYDNELIHSVRNSNASGKGQIYPYNKNSL